MGHWFDSSTVNTKHNIMENAVNNFIKEFCTEVKNDETSDFVELMMDNHSCISWNDKEYYLPKDNSMWNKEQNMIWDYLYSCCGL